ncbi:MAG: hydantoinase/oxoprolinase family protein, partial [Thermomicrobiales bacterium]
YQVVNESMASAARVHFAEKGRDPRQYTLLAFGGAGPLHAVAVARRLRISEVLVPSQAGVLSAFGFLTAPISFDFIRTYITRIDRANWERLGEIYSELEARGKEVLSEAGVPAEHQQLIRSADMRYAGQLFEITVPVPGGVLNDDSWREMADLFHKAYHELYGRHSPEAAIEALNWRLLATGPTPAVDLAEVPSSQNGTPGIERAKKGTRPAYFGNRHGWQDTTVFDRYALRPGDEASGPAVIEERESTIVVPPATTFIVDSYLNVRLTLQAEQG